MDDIQSKKKLKIRIEREADGARTICPDLILIYVLSGKLEVRKDDGVSELAAGDVILINANRYFVTRRQSDEDICYVRLSIAFELVSDILLKGNCMFRCDSSHERGKRYQDLRDALDKALSIYVGNNADVLDFRFISTCYQVMAVLVDKFLVSSAYVRDEKGQDRAAERVQQINEYVHNNFRSSIRLSDVAKELYLSEGYLSRFIKKTYGMNFVDYLYSVRLYYAVEEMLSSDSSITSIAFKYGFPSVASFDRVFKKNYGMLPSAYRKRMAGAATAAESEGVSEEDLQGVKAYLDSDRGRSSELAASIEITPGMLAGEPLQRSWETTINAGRAESLMNQQLQRHLLEAHEGLGFTYVRVWNVFSENMLIDLKALGTSFNFSRIDASLDFLVEHHLKPHLELANKTQRVLRNARYASDDPRELMYLPPLDDWKRLIEAFAHHICLRYGVKEVGSWRIELWLEQVDPLTEASIERFLDYFDATYRIFRRHCPGIAIGGCEWRLNGDTSEFKQIVEAWGKRSVRPDFISECVYPYETTFTATGALESRPIRDGREVLKSLAETKLVLLESKLAGTPLYVTEWNCSICSRNYINDTCYKGADVIRTLLRAYGVVDEMGYYFLSDIESDSFDSSPPLFGGLGMMTKDGVPKPSGYALLFLKKLKPLLVACDENVCVTSDGESSFGIICHNARQLNDYYYRTPEDEVDCDAIGDYFDDRRDLAIDVTINGIAAGRYHKRTLKVGQHHGSVLDLWRSLEYGDSLAREDVAYIREVCKPQLTIETVECAGGSVGLHLKLLANEFAFVELRRLDE